MNFIELNLSECKNPSTIHQAIEKNHEILVLKKAEIDRIKKKETHISERTTDANIEFFQKKDKKQPIKKPDALDNQEAEKQIDLYVSMIMNTPDQEQLMQIITDDYQSANHLFNDPKMLFRIQLELLKQIKEIQEVIEEEKENITKEDLEEFKNEIQSLHLKITTISQIKGGIDHDRYTDTQPTTRSKIK